MCDCEDKPLCGCEPTIVEYGGDDTQRVDYEVAYTKDDASLEEDAILQIRTTEEGLIIDLIKDGDVVGTFGATAQELADNFCH